MSFLGAPTACLANTRFNETCHAVDVPPVWGLGRQGPAYAYTGGVV